jgi:hypothetical protein
MGMNAEALQMAYLVLAYSLAEFCAPVHKLDEQLTNVMRLITGTAQTTTRSRTFPGIEE